MSSDGLDEGIPESLRHAAFLPLLSFLQIGPASTGSENYINVISGRNSDIRQRAEALTLLPSASGVVIARIFNIWGIADLFNALYRANHAALMAGQLGATYFIPTFIVPLLLIRHGLSFRILMQSQIQPAMQEAGTWHDGLV